MRGSISESTSPSCSSGYRALFYLSLRQQSGHWRDSVAAREDVRGEHALIDAQVIAQHALENGTQISGRLEVALLVKVGLLDARPIGYHAAALERTAQEERNCCGAVIGTGGAVDAGGATELSDKRHHGLAPSVAYSGLDRPEGGIECAEQLSQPAVHHTLVIVGVPAVERERADTRTVWVRQELRRCAGSFGEIGAHLVDVADLNDGTHFARLAIRQPRRRERRQANALFQHARERRIGVTIEVEQARRGVVTHRRQPRRHP